MFAKIFAAARAHKIRTFFVLALLAGGGWYWYGRATAVPDEVRYVLATVERGTVVASVTGTGQVASSQQVDVKPKVSGLVTSVSVKKGDHVRAGAVIATIDSRDAQKAVRDAETSLETAELSLQQLHQPPTDLELLQSDHSLEAAKESQAAALESLDKAFSDGYATMSDAWLDLPQVMISLDGILHGHELSTNQANVDYYADRLSEVDPVSPYAASAVKDYDVARAKYEAAFAAYKSVSRISPPTEIEGALRDAATTALDVAQAVKSTSNLVQSYRDAQTAREKTPASASATHQSSLSSDTGTMNAVVSSLSGATRAIDDARQSIITTARTAAERQASADALRAGPDALDIRSQEISVSQRRDALVDARSKLADYVVTAPFDGVIAACDLKRGDTASGSTVAATLLAEQQLAEIPFNEIDVAKVAVGQPATLTFDAVPDLTISGKVADIDTVGTTSQGVVTYKVKIAFDTQDERVKPSMTVTAAIVIQAKTDVLTVPSAAVKGATGAKYVEVAANAPAQVAGTRGVSLNAPPERRDVEVGLESDDSVEIVSGLEEGENVVISTIQPTVAPAATSGGGQTQLFGGSGSSTRLLR